MLRSFLLLLALCFILVHCRRDKKSDLSLNVGKAKKLPEISNKQGKKESKQEPTSDVVPQSDEGGETTDKQKHPFNTRNETLETGMPPRYPLKAMSAEVSAHDNEIGGCRDHPNALRVCQRCSNPCFPEEHETYTYSYCRKSCRHCDSESSGFNTFWRLRALSEFEPTWMLKQLEFYATPDDNNTLVDDPQRAYASSSYSGFIPSYAFDGKVDTAWYPSGWGKHDNQDDWIAFEFPVAVRIHALRMVLDGGHRTASPKKIVLEASNKKFGPFTKKWIINNPTYEVDRIYKLLQCPVLWRKFEDEDGMWCFRQISKFEAWETAKSSCEIEGGKLASVLSTEEQRFITDELMLCGPTWIGLAHRENAYFWDDGSNSSNTKCNDGSGGTYKNWKQGVTYSDVQKENLNCVAMDRDGYWQNFHCTNKFYFLCKKKLVPTEAPREDLVERAWPYDPEIPPLIFLFPNVTVPVINSRHLEPGVFPDANGNVEEDADEEESKEDMLYEQTVEHLKEKGLKPSEEISNDVSQDETDYMKQLNKIALNANSKDDYRNETSGDEMNRNSSDAKQQVKALEKAQANNFDQNITDTQASQNVDKPPGVPVVPAPSTNPAGPDDTNNENQLPRIVDGKPVGDKNGGTQNSDDSGKPTVPSAVSNGSDGGNGALQDPKPADVPTPTPSTATTPPAPSTSAPASTDNSQPAQPAQPTNANSNNNGLNTSSEQTQQQQTNTPPATANQESGNNANVSNTGNDTQQQQGQQEQNNNNQNNSNQQNGNQQQQNNQQASNNNNNQQQTDNNQQQQQNNNNNNNQQNNNNNQQNNNNNNNQQTDNNNNNNNNNNNQQSNNNNQQSNGDQSNNGSNNNNNNNNQETGTAPAPTNNTQGSWGGNSGLPPVMGGPAPSKIPEPPPSKEGVNDNDNEKSVGGQSDQEGQEDEEENTDDNNVNTDNDNEKAVGGQQGNQEDEEDVKTGNQEQVRNSGQLPGNGKDGNNIPEKPDHNDGTSNQQQQQQQQQLNFARNPKAKGASKLAHKKSKAASVKATTVKAAPKKLLRKTKKARKSKLSKKVKIHRKPENDDDDEKSSGSGSEGADDEVDEVLESITNDLW